MMINRLLATPRNSLERKLVIADIIADAKDHENTKEYSTIELNDIIDRLNTCPRCDITAQVIFDDLNALIRGI